MLTRRNLSFLIVFISLLTTVPGCGSLGGVQQGLGSLLGGILNAPAKVLKSKPSTQDTKRKQASENARKSLQQQKAKRNYNRTGR